MVSSDELYEKGSEVLNRFRSGSPVNPSQGPTSYDMVPGLRRLVAEWAFGGTWARPALDIKHRSMATVAALTVLGREPQLRNHIRNALSIGVTKEQVAEVILHVMIHGGAPATLNALRVAGEAFKERPDLPYDPEPISPPNSAEERYQKATDIRKQVYGEGGTKPVISQDEVYDMEYARQTIGYIFGVMWSREALDLKSRIICTLSALTVLGREAQIPRHVRAALNLGLTKKQIMEVLSHLMFYGGWDASINAMTKANDVLYGRV